MKICRLNETYLLKTAPVPGQDNSRLPLTAEKRIRHTTHDTGHRTQDTGHKAHDTRHKAQGTRHRAQGTGHRTHDKRHTSSSGDFNRTERKSGDGGAPPANYS
ncbi:hypothetical protein J6590_080070 [Homalodisca vitripennis]|nr:hypothetical protein J6590_080070 [Homalodisca vitripennis]